MKNKNFIIVVLGQIISLLGNSVQRFAMSLYILDITGSAAIFSTILAVSTIPYIIFAPLAGFLADTINRKKIMVCLDILSAAILAIYSVLIVNYNSIIVIAGIMFLLSTLYTLYSPAVISSIPQIVEKNELTAANGIIQQVGYIVNILGPILAGILYGFMNIRMIILLNCISFLISGILEMLLDIPDLKLKKKSQHPILESTGEMIRVFKYLKDEKQIVLGIIYSYALTNIFVVPVLTVVSPFFINVTLNMPSGIYGLVEAVFVLGMIVGGLFITFKPKLFRLEIIHKTMYPMIFAILVMSFSTYLSSESKRTILILYGIGGFSIMMSLALSNIISMTYIQQNIKIEMLGKVSAFSTAVATASVAPGQLIYGQLIDMNLELYIILLITFFFCIWVIRFVKANAQKANVLVKFENEKFDLVDRPS